MANNVWTQMAQSQVKTEQKIIAKLRTYPLEKRNALSTLLGIHDKK